jgi:hypothetical protein
MLDTVDDGLLELVVGRHCRNSVMVPLTLMHQESSSLSSSARAGPLSSVSESACPKTTRSARHDEMLEASLLVTISDILFASFL